MGGGGYCPPTPGPLPGIFPGTAGNLGGPQTPCLTKNETLVTALALNWHTVDHRHMK